MFKIYRRRLDLSSELKAYNNEIKSQCSTSCLHFPKDFIYLFEGGEREREKQTPHWAGSPCGTRSQDSRIMTWAAIRHLTHWAIQSPASFFSFFFFKKEILACWLSLSEFIWSKWWNPAGRPSQNYKDLHVGGTGGVIPSAVFCNAVPPYSWHSEALRRDAASSRVLVEFGCKHYFTSLHLR